MTIRPMIVKTTADLSVWISIWYSPAIANCISIYRREEPIIRRAIVNIVY